MPTPAGVSVKGLRLEITTCASCEAPISFIASAKSGRPIPVDAKPLKVVTLDGHVIDGVHPRFGALVQ